MMLLLTGCAFWFGERDLAPYPITRADLERAAPAAGPALPAGFATPTIRSVAPDPLHVELSTEGYPIDVELARLKAPEAFADALRRHARGAEQGTNVNVLVERFQSLCLTSPEGRVPAGVTVVVEGSVRFGGGDWRRVEVTRNGDDCERRDETYAAAGVAFAGEIGRLALAADPSLVSLPTLPPMVDPVLCVARDARPDVERHGQRAAEVFSFYSVGVGVTTLQGTRTKGNLFAGDAAETDASRDLTDALHHALAPVLPGLRIGDELCSLLPPEQVSVPTVWARLDHQWVGQVLRSTEWVTQISSGFFSFTVSDREDAATGPFAYWRAGLALCVGDTCRGTTLAGVDDAGPVLLEHAGVPGGWNARRDAALQNLGGRARGVVQDWIKPPEQPVPY